MLNYLRRHPFAVEAYFDRVVAVSFAFPAELLRTLVPPGLEVDVYRPGAGAGGAPAEPIGFVAVALVWTRDLRPAGWPRAWGQDFFLAGYRVFARCAEPSGRRLRGLRILRSETDRRRMVWAGNVLTRYAYRRVRVNVHQDGAAMRVRCLNAEGDPTLDLGFDLDSAETPLPAGSPFPDWRTARQFAGPMPFTFSDEGRGRILMVEGSRESWTPRPVRLLDWRVALFDELPFRGVTPVAANAFAVEKVAYRWEPGRVISCGGAA